MAIDVVQLKSEFGTYIKTNQQEILKKLTQPTVSQKYMSTVVSKDLEWRTTQAVIDDIVQGFQKAWTPKGTAKFTPIAIPQRRHKADLEFYPDDVFESWLGFLTDEKKNRKDWPITKYIIEELLIPKVNDNRELKLIGKGVYEAPTPDVAQLTGKSMDGFLTILQKKKDLGTSNINFITTIGVPTKENIVDWMEDFVDLIDEVYQDIDMPIYLSNKWYKAYKRKYRDLYGDNSDFKGTTELVLESNNRIAKLPSMSGSDIIFTTPKANFKRLLNANEGASSINIESVDRKVKVFSDWHESVGFAIEEAIFAYVPEDDSGSEGEGL